MKCVHLQHVVEVVVLRGIVFVEQPAHNCVCVCAIVVVLKVENVL